MSQDNIQYGASFTFADVISTEYGVWISGTGTWDSPERDVEYITVPGRNGSLIVDNGRFQPVTITYPCFIAKGFEHRFDAFKAALLARPGFYKLKDTYHPDHYRTASFRGPITPATGIYNKSGSFDVSFYCQPELWLDSGDTPVLLGGYGTSGFVLNPSLYQSKPMIIVKLEEFGDTGTFTLGGQTVTITDSPSETIFIDCERQDAYFGSTNLNPYITLTTGAFPEIQPGESAWQITGDVESLTVFGRWWTV